LKIWKKYMEKGIGIISKPVGKLVKLGFKITFLLLFTLLIVVAFWFNYIRYQGNFYKIDSTLFRSGQLYFYNLPVYWKKFHFKSILNLRGVELQGKWYQFEKQFARFHRIKLITLSLSDRQEVPPERLMEIVKLVEQLPKPVLIHCKAGADRTGLIVAAYLRWKGDLRWKGMLSIKFGHFPYLGSPTEAMDRSLVKFEKFLTYRKGVFNGGAKGDRTDTGRENPSIGR